MSVESYSVTQPTGHYIEETGDDATRVSKTVPIGPPRSQTAVANHPLPQMVLTCLCADHPDDPSTESRSDSLILAVGFNPRDPVIS